MQGQKRSTQAMSEDTKQKTLSYFKTSDKNNLKTGKQIDHV